MLENTGVFRPSLSLREGVGLSQAEVRNLKNAVWKTVFETVRSSGCAEMRYHLNGLLNMDSCR